MALRVTSPSFPASSPFPLEACIRSALETGYLSPGLVAYVHRVWADPALSEHDRALIQLLKDAIADGCIRMMPPGDDLDDE